MSVSSPILPKSTLVEHNILNSAVISVSSTLFVRVFVRAHACVFVCVCACACVRMAYKTQI